MFLIVFGCSTLLNTIKETKSFPLRVHDENNKKIKNKRLNVFILSIAS